MKLDQVLTQTLADEWGHFEKVVLGAGGQPDEVLSLAMQAFYAGAIAATMPVALLEYGVNSEDVEFSATALTKLIENAREGQRFCRMMAAIETMQGKGAGDDGA